MDVPVTVNTEWTGPDGFMTNNTAILESNTTYTYTSIAMVSSFGKDKSGNYTCTATISSNSSFLTNNSTQSGTAEEIIHGIYCQSQLLLIVLHHYY